uniref:RanBP2-type domain-containing protein n=1 Tax=Sphaeramia orbicularis TaxID=375764 RepID=A0A672ZZF4_9TELE
MNEKGLFSFLFSQTFASLQRLSTALNILEKYGCNLTNPSRPKYWRTVKHNNPVFRATVDAIQGGRAVLCLYGYSNQESDGLSFPDDVTDPDVGRVAAVTLEVMSLRMELEMLIKVCACLIIPTNNDDGTFYVAENCSICGIFRISTHCVTCLQGLCSECDKLYHSYPERSRHHRTAVASSVSSASKNIKNHRSECTLSDLCFAHGMNSNQDVLCEECECPRMESVSSIADESQPATITGLYYVSFLWQCKSCTMVNAASSILCEVCERPRLATRPPVTPSHPPITPPRPPLQSLFSLSVTLQWVCQFCTYLNYSPATVCEMCDLARPEPAPLPVKLRPPSPVRRVPALPVKSKEPTPENLESWRQRLMKEEGLKLIQLIRDGEKKGVSPEEVYTSMKVAKESCIMPCTWLKTELPMLLPAETESGVQLSRAEAKQAWLTAGGDIERATRQALRDRLTKVKELCSLGFCDEAHCHEVLRQSGGQVRGALALLQRPLLEPFHERIWSDNPEPPLDVHHPDKQHICRRLLAVYGLPSWGRCELALSLLLEHSAPYSLEDVVQAVQESHDREFIKRVLAKECPICLSIFPHSKVL